MPTLKKRAAPLWPKVSSQLSSPTTQWALSDFALDLNASLAPENHLWVGSGQMTVQPQVNKALGVGGWNAPPLAGRDFTADFVLHLNGHEVRDAASHGKGDVGLLYQGGTWYPHKIVRSGTYQQDVDGRRISVETKSELVPLFGTAGFLIKVELSNRGKQPLLVKMVPEVNPGHPVVRPLDEWDFGRPKEAKLEAVSVADGAWQNDQVHISLHTSTLDRKLATGETMTAYLTFIFRSQGEAVAPIDTFPNMVEQCRNAWQDRLTWATRRIPRLTSNIPGLQDYYQRSVASGLVCIWEHPDFVSQPFLATCGMDGGALCAYLWDIGGYVPGMATMMLGEDMLTIARNLASIDLTQNYAVTPAGTGVGVRYAYSPWSFVSLVWGIFRHIGPDETLYQEAKRIVLNAEQAYPTYHGLMDFGGQQNLLEMRGTGWQHITASPNAERAWNLYRLADMARLVGADEANIRPWRQKAETIRQAVTDELWSRKAQWFVEKSADGHTADRTYSIQVFDAIRAGVGDEAIKKAVFSHLEPGKFLGAYGVSSVSREDSVHYEVNDPDWSGGGAYMGEGPQLALILYEQGRPALAWDVLQRFFWLGKHLAYFPQEQMADRPSTPAHKRANIISGLAGAEAILYGLIGFDPRPDGSLWINPQPPLGLPGTSLRIEGLGFRGHFVDIQLEPDSCTILLDEQTVYSGVIKKVKVM